jgi:thiamine-phosphate pyrophosphorylase
VAPAADRRTRLQSARLYFVADRGGLEHALDGALAGGADLIQLRDKTADDREVVDAAAWARERCARHGALFILNDRPDLVAACNADGVHVGQDDLPPGEARALVGRDRIVGRSTHAPDQGAAADADPEVDYLAVGPVHATPTKPGRPAAGIDYVRWAAANVATPWFAIGGLDATTLSAVTAAGATRIVVVRAIEAAIDPEAAARTLRAGLEVPVA